MARARRSGLFLALAVGWATAAGCYSFHGGGGLPGHIRTGYVAPVENETPRFGLSETFTQELLDASRSRLGLRLTSEADADAVIRAAIVRFTDDAVAFEAREGVGAEIFQRRVTIVARVEIVDAVRQEVLWSSSSVTGAGEYAPDTETEDVAIEVALENLVQRVVDGAQAQW